MYLAKAKLAFEPLDTRAFRDGVSDWNWSQHNTGSDLFEHPLESHCMAPSFFFYRFSVMEKTASNADKWKRFNRYSLDVPCDCGVDLWVRDHSIRLWSDDPWSCSRLCRITRKELVVSVNYVCILVDLRLSCLSSSATDR